MNKGFSLIELVVSMFLISFSLLPLNFLMIKLLKTNENINTNLENIYIKKNIIEESNSLDNKLCENMQFNRLYDLLNYLEIKTDGYVDNKEKYILTVSLLENQGTYCIYEIRINDLRGFRIIEQE